jgi:hypothetical protein
LTRRHLIVPGYDGLYAASEEGEILSLGRTVPFRCHGEMTTRTHQPRVLKSYRSSGGYVMVDLSLLNGTTKKCLVHRLVAATFLNLEPGQEVNHKNFDRADNRLINLEVCTRKENTAHTVTHKRHGGPYGRQRFTREDRIVIGERARDVGCAQAAREFKCAAAYASTLKRKLAGSV